VVAWPVALRTLLVAQFFVWVQVLDLGLSMLANLLCIGLLYCAAWCRVKATSSEALDHDVYRSVYGFHLLVDDADGEARGRSSSGGGSFSDGGGGGGGGSSGGGGAFAMVPIVSPPRFGPSGGSGVSISSIGFDACVGAGGVSADDALSGAPPGAARIGGGSPGSGGAEAASTVLLSDGGGNADDDDDDNDDDEDDCNPMHGDHAEISV